MGGCGGDGGERAGDPPGGQRCLHRWVLSRRGGGGGGADAHATVPACMLLFRSCGVPLDKFRG
jgi:hypothetical protein